MLRQDRRTTQRHFHPLPATVRYGVSGGEEKVSIHNLSDKGVCFRSGVRFPVGAALEITTILPQELRFGGRKVRYLAQVVRASLHHGEFLIATSIRRCETVCEPAQPVTAPPPSQMKRPHTSKGHKPRRFSRYNCSSQVQFRAADSERILTGELRNLSLTGCYVKTSEPCPVGGGVEIVLHSGETRIYAQGRVKTVKPNHGMAVEFAGDLAERLRRLPRFVQVVAAGHDKDQEAAAEAPARKH